MTGAVLIGGQSKRFGTDKVLSRLNGLMLVEHVVHVLQTVFDEVILVGHARPGLEGYTVVQDIRPGLGPLGGIYTALTAARSDRCFVCAADMPNLDAAFISHIAALSEGYEIVMPVWSQGREPLHAVYRKTLLQAIERLLEAGQRSIYALAQQANTLFVTEETIRLYGDPSTMFANINTPHDMKTLTAGSVQEAIQGRPEHGAQPAARSTTSNPATAVRKGK